MRSFVLSLSFLLLIFNMSLSQVEAEDKINKGILFQLKSVTINGEPKNKCLHTQTASLSGYIQLNFSHFIGIGKLFRGKNETAILAEV